MSVGLHINALLLQHERYINRVRPSVNLLLNPKVEEAAKVKAASPETKLIGRVTIPPGDGVVHGWYLDAGTAEGARAAGRRAAEYCLSQRVSQCDAWILNNEPPVKTIEQVKLLAEFDSEFARQMSRGGSRALIGAFSRGTPEVAALGGAAVLNAYIPALRVAHDVGAWLAIHQYGKYPLLHDAEFLALRWQRHILPYYRGQGVPIPQYVITECGYDLGSGVDAQNRDGWRTSPYAAHYKEYGEHLLQVAQEYAKDSACLGATLFCAGFAGWQSFTVDGELLDYLATLDWPKFGNVVAPVPAPIPTPTPPSGGTVSFISYTNPLSKHSSSREGRGIQYLILHTTESPVDVDEEETLRYLVQNERKVSIHDYLAQFPDGSMRLYNMVPYSKAAHHAGADTARLPNGYTGTEVNRRTIGLEIYRRVEQQVSAVLWEAAIDWAVARCRQYNLQVSQILSHAQVDPTRRSDPVGLNMTWFRDRVAQELGAVVQVPSPVAADRKLPLPEDESLEDLTTFLQKATYWAEEEVRQYNQRQFARASAIRLSLAKYLAKGRDRWQT